MTPTASCGPRAPPRLSRASTPPGVSCPSSCSRPSPRRTSRRREAGPPPTRGWPSFSRRSLTPKRPPRSPRWPPASWPVPNLAERDLLLLLLRVDEARTALLPAVEDVDVAHLGLRAILATLRLSPETAPEAL